MNHENWFRRGEPRLTSGGKAESIQARPFEELFLIQG